MHEPLGRVRGFEIGGSNAIENRIEPSIVIVDHHHHHHHPPPLIDTRRIWLWTKITSNEVAATVSAETDQFSGISPWNGRYSLFHGFVVWIDTG